MARSELRTNRHDAKNAKRKDGHEAPESTKAESVSSEIGNRTSEIVDKMNRHDVKTAKSGDMTCRIQNADSDS